MPEGFGCLADLLAQERVLTHLAELACGAALSRGLRGTLELIAIRH